MGKNTQATGVDFTAKSNDKLWSDFVSKAKAGDEQAYEQLYLQSSMQLFFFIKKMIKNHADAMDVMQDCYAVAFQKLDTLREGDKFLSWLYQIAANRSKNFLKKQKDVFFIQEEDYDGAAEVEEESKEFLPESVVDSKEKSRLVMEIIDGLPAMQRMCILLYYYSSLSVADIAKTLDCPQGTVKSNLNYGRKKIKEEVLMLEKEKDTKLYAAVPLWFLLDRYPEIAGDALLSANEVERAWSEITQLTGNGAAETSGAGEAMNAAAKASAVGIKGKLFIGIIALFLIGGGVWYFVSNHTSTTEAAFVDPVFEQQLRAELGIPEEESLEEEALNQIDTVTIYQGHILLGDNIYMGYGEGTGEKQLFDGEIPVAAQSGSEITQISDLKKLEHLNRLMIVGDVPGSLESLKDCQELWSIMCYGTNADQLASLETSERTRYILLEDVGAGDYSFLARQKGITRLSLANCQISDWGFLNSMSNVKQFILSDTAGTIHSLPDMSGMKNLVSFSISLGRDAQGHGTPLDIANISRLTQLQALKINSATVMNLNPIMSLKNLKSLMLYGVFDTFPNFSGLPQLQVLWVEGVANSADLSPFAGLQGLEAVKINFGDLNGGGGTLGEELSYPEERQFAEIFNRLNEEIVEKAEK